jgi:signal transduction histidine kinase
MAQKRHGAARPDARTARPPTEPRPTLPFATISALCNLLSNACRFSPNQTAVEIAVLEQLDHVQISVIDRGPGVPAAVVDKLFRSFSQVDSSASRSHEGAGLGLRICKAIAEAHGGRIGCMQAPGGGSNFFLLLPRVVAQ